MIKSALSLQNKVDNKYITNIDKFNNDFAVEALSNAGQRLGMTGDGIKYSSFTIKDLLSYLGKSDKVDSKLSYNCAIKYKQNAINDISAIMSIIEQGNVLNESNEYNISLIDKDNNDDINIFNRYIFTQDLSFDKYINNIEYFTENSYLSVEENIFKTFLFGKKLGYREDDDFNIEIMYNEFDLSSNILERGIRMYHLFSLSNSNYYAIIDIQKDHSDVNSKDFILKVFIMNDSSINVTEDTISKEDIKNSFSLKYLREQFNHYKENNRSLDDIYNRFIDTSTNESYFNFINENTTLYKLISSYTLLDSNNNTEGINDLMRYDSISHAILKTTNLFNSTIIGENLDELSQKISSYLTQSGVSDDINEAVTKIYRDTSFYASIIKNTQASDLSTELALNTTKNVITSTTTGYINNEIKNLLDSDYIGIDKRVEYINNDIIYLFPKLLRQYNELSFNSKAKLLKNILYRIYEKISATSSYNYTQYGTLYIPIDYEFKYVNNNHNDTEIYYSNDFFVNLISLNDNTTDQIKSILSSDDILIYDYDGENKIKTFTFSVSYNTMYEDIINNIYVSYLFTLPYINAKNSWSINDIDTNILAKSSNEAIQTLYIIYCKRNTNNDILGKFINVNDVNQLNLEQKWNTSSFLSGNVNVKYTYPVLTSNNIEKFINSTILFICDKSCVENANNNNLANLYTVFATISYGDTGWFVNPIVLDENNKVNLDLSQVINQADLIAQISSNVNTNLKSFNQLFINSRKNNNAGVRDQDSTYIQNNSLMMTVQTAEEFLKDMILDASKNSDTTAYNNNLNFILGFVNRDEKISYQYKDENGYYIPLLDVYDAKRPLQYNGAPPKTLTMTETFYRNIEYFKKLTYTKSVDNINFDVYDSKGTFIEQISESQYETVQKFTESILDTRELDTKEVVGFSDNELINAEDRYFTFDVPLLNLKEMLVANFNVMHRINILAISEEGKLLNAYLGTDYTDASQQNLVFSSNYQNINLGKSKLIDPEVSFSAYNSFKIKFNKVSIDTNNIERVYTDDNVIVNNTKLIGESETYRGNSSTINITHNVSAADKFYCNTEFCNYDKNTNTTIVNWNRILSNIGYSTTQIEAIESFYVNSELAQEYDSLKLTNHVSASVVKLDGTYISSINKVMTIDTNKYMSIFTVEITRYNNNVYVYIPEDCLSTINLHYTA